MRDKLIELMKDTRANAAWHNWGYEESADYLIANGVTIQKWIPVTERLPKMNELVLVYDGEDVFPCFFMGDRFYDCTHWMPLPEPPKED